MSTSKKDTSYYVVTYRDQKDGAVLSLKVRAIEDSSLGLGFVALSGFIFEQESILIQPEEEAKRKKFENVKTLHLSVYSIFSITEMGLETPKLAFKNDKSNLLMMSPPSAPPPNE
jgi:hypothetical protein